MKGTKTKATKQPEREIPAGIAALAVACDALHNLNDEFCLAWTAAPHVAAGLFEDRDPSMRRWGFIEDRIETHAKGDERLRTVIERLKEDDNEGDAHLAIAGPAFWLGMALALHLMTEGVRR